MLKFNKTYFGLFILLLIIEVLIAMYVRDRFIRPYIGDVLVVMLIYCFVKSFIEIKPIIAAVLVLLFAIGVEFLQYANAVERLGLQDNKIARVVIGSSFEWMDILCYIVGIVITLPVERFSRTKTESK